RAQAAASTARHPPRVRACRARLWPVPPRIRPPGSSGSVAHQRQPARRAPGAARAPHHRSPRPAASDPGPPRGSAEWARLMESLPDGPIKQTLEVPPKLALLPIRDLVVFPYMVVPLMVSREMSVAAIDEALATKDRLVLLCAQRDESEDEPPADAIHTFGTVGMIMRMRKLSDGRIKVLVQGLMRARITGFVQKSPCFTVSVERVEEPAPPPGAEAEALMRAVRDDLTKFSQGGKLQS